MLAIVVAATVTLPSVADAPPASAPVAALQRHLADVTPIANAGFAAQPLSRGDADEAAKLLVADHARIIRRDRAADWKDRVVRDGDKTMRYSYEVFGDKPKAGRSLYISMHGGGNTAPRVNDQQWENQKRLYRPAEGVYLAPRAPTNTWNLWHEPHIDRLFDRLIADLVVLEDVNPDRIYLMGYSAGGDGVYQLAPRMADRFAAASMMAGHPNDASPLGLRNLPFAIHVGELDGGYKRNAVAAEWGRKLADLRKADPGGYEHVAKIHAGKGHWMDRQDAEAVPWMARFKRDPFPKRVVWKQSSTTHDRYYWLAVPPGTGKAGALVRAELSGQEIAIQSDDVEKLLIRLNDRMVDLDKPVTVTWNGKTVFTGKATRTIATLQRTLSERGDPMAMFAAEVAAGKP